MKNKKIEKFINDYETKIKKARDIYYEKVNSKQYELLTKKHNYNAISICITILISILILFIFYSLVGDIIALVVATIMTITTRLIIQEDDNLQNNDFTRGIRKLGYFSIESYDEKLIEYVTGPCGVYKEQLEELKELHNIDEDTTILYAQNNDRYYAWTTKDKLHLLNTKISEKPKVKTYHIGHIRYYRFDKTQKMVIIKTDTDDLYFLQKSLDDIQELLPNKEFHEVKTFEPEEYINDFELYIHDAKSELEKKERSCAKKKRIALNTAIITLATMMLCIGVQNFAPKYKILCEIISAFTLIPYVINLSRYSREKIRLPKNEYEIIKMLNENREHQNRFNELKISLAIDNTSEAVYTKEGAQYLTWTRNGYFHIFLNMIYFNVVYMAINTKDVEYYKKEKDECIIKLKDRTLTFKPDAEKVFKKVLPNKDYYWIKDRK